MTDDVSLPTAPDLLAQASELTLAEKLRAAVANVQTAADLAAYYGGANDTLADLEKARSAADDLVDEVEQLTAEVERLRDARLEALVQGRQDLDEISAVLGIRKDLPVDRIVVWAKAAGDMVREAWVERDQARGLLRGMARRASSLRRQADRWHSRAEQEFRDRVADTAKAMAESGQQRAEVSRLREQLAAQPVIPLDAETQLARAIHSYWDLMHGASGEDYDETAAGQAHQVMKVLRSWGVSSFEVEAPKPQPRHEVQILTVPGGFAAECLSCQDGTCGSEQQAEDWKDEHEADTLRPSVESPNHQANQHDEGRPSCSERLAPRSGVELIADERARQVEVEGWTPAHDAEHDNDDLVRAASCYLTPPGQRQMMLLYDNRPVGWPWGSASWKPSDDRVRELVKAAALIAAEIDRIQAQDAASAARSEATPEELSAHAKVMADQCRQFADFIDTHAPSPSLRKEGGDSGNG